MLNKKNTVVIIAKAAIFIVLICSFTFLSVKAIGEQSSPEEFISYLDERIPRLMATHHIPGVSIALVQKGKTVWSEAYGYADIEEGREMTTDTYCRVESISKSVTAWGIMKLVEECSVDLDSPLVQYIDSWDFPPSDYSPENITVRQLLSHTAGMPLGDVFDRYSPKEDVPSIKTNLTYKAILNRQPGTAFSYSNTGYSLLELLIEEVTGRDFAEFMTEEVLLPLGMYKSTFTWSRDLCPEIPMGYDANREPVPLYVYPDKASGGLLATAGDIAAFITAGMTGFNQNDKGVLSIENINKIYTPMADEIGIYGQIFDAYGLGHYIETLAGGNQAVSHGGQGGGCMTFYYSVPDTGDGIVILSNSASWLFYAHILNDWAEWSGLPPVGMGRIIIGNNLLWAVVGLIMLIAFIQLYRVGKGLISGRRSFAPLAKKSLYLRLVQCTVFITITSVLLWCLNQEYLEIASLFPSASSWLGVASFLFALSLLVSAMLPYKDKNYKCLTGSYSG